MCMELLFIVYLKCSQTSFFPFRFPFRVPPRSQNDRADDDNARGVEDSASVMSSF